MATSLLSQKDRLFSFQSPLGADKLLVRSFQGSESISELFRYELELVSEDPNIDYDQIIGRRVTVGIRQYDGTTFRYFDGFVSRFEQAPAPGRLATYYAEMVPWLWFLTLTKDCLIYQEKSIPDVIRATFEKFGFQDFEFRLQGKHDPWEYLCQYRETALDFVSRLMEIEGVCYFFRHEEGKHTLVMADNKAAHQPCPYQSSFKYEHVFDEGYRRAEDTIFEWRPKKQVRSGKYTHKEYNFVNPKNRLLSEIETTCKAGTDAKYEVYDFPGEFEERPEGDDWVRLRMEELEVDHHVVDAVSNCRSLHSGYRFTLREHERGEQNDSYLLTEVSHDGHEGSMYTGDDAGKARYENRFRSIPAKVQYRPKRKTEKHIMRGRQTAVVTGPQGEEIYTDEYGRVKVQFNWDRVGQYDENTSCWMRVMQTWTGNGWGQIWIPRIGQEVVVDFFESDPDRPIITGCIYNSDNMPPYGLPGNQTRSGVKTRSSKGAGQDNFNELRFEDKKGEEMLLMHAEKDMDVSVENDLTELVERDRFLKVERDQSEQVERNKDSTVGGDRAAAIGGDDSLTVGGSLNERVGSDCVIEAGSQIHLKAGSRIVLEAGAGITLIGPGGSIDIGPSGVIIEGTMVNINSGMPNMGSGKPVQAKEAKKPTMPSKMPRP